MEVENCMERKAGITGLMIGLRIGRELEMWKLKNNE